MTENTESAEKQRTITGKVVSAGMDKTIAVTIERKVSILFTESICVVQPSCSLMMSRTSAILAIPSLLQSVALTPSVSLGVWLKLLNVP